MKRLAVLLMGGALALGACASAPTAPGVSLPTIAATTATRTSLLELPPPSRKVAVAVYGFNDQTGQFKPVEGGQTLSRAVSQGGGAMLVKALQDAGGKEWFTVVERERLDNLLRERQIISEMRARYLGETGTNPDALPAMLFAGVILEGGVVGFDTATKTGGAGARFLGVGASAQYRQDTVTVSLRAVSVRTGEVLSTVTVSKTIASQSIGVNAFRYVAFKELGEAEAGFSRNEPDQVALQQAIEKAVYALIMEGAQQRLWAFADPIEAAPHFARYQQERSGVWSAERAARDEAQVRRNAPNRPASQPGKGFATPARPSRQGAPTSGSSAEAMRKSPSREARSAATPPA